MEGFQGFPELIGLFFCEFHPTQGPKVIFEVPEGLTFTPCTHQTLTSPPPETMEPSIHHHHHHLSLDFDTISEYAIPKPEFCNRLIAISTSHHKVVGFPVSIEHSRYERNALIFNLCFVFDKWRDVSPFFSIVMKMARVLRALEMENEYVSQSSLRASLQTIMEQLIESLNVYNECQIPIYGNNTINLKLFPIYSDPPSIQDYQVPILTVNLQHYVEKRWDLAIQRILPFINGIFSVKKISELSQVQHSLTKLAVQHLLFYGCIQMIDIFQFSNVYGVSQELNGILSNTAQQKELVQFVSLGHESPTFEQLFNLYCGLKLGYTVKEWAEEYNVHDLNIDIRRFIVFGVLKKFIHRIHKYPILMQNFKVPATRREDVKDIFELKMVNVRKYLTGHQHYDDICTIFNCSYKELDELLSNDVHVKMIWR